MPLRPKTLHSKYLFFFFCIFVFVIVVFLRHHSATEDVVIGQTISWAPTDSSISFQKEDSSLSTSTTTIKGVYKTYTEPLKLGDNVKTVLFFDAGWSLQCQKSEKDFITTEIPSNVQILSVDFDTFITLRESFDIIDPCTFVLLDKEGKTQKMWVGGGINMLKQKIQ